MELCCTARCLRASAIVACVGGSGNVRKDIWVVEGRMIRVVERKASSHRVQSTVGNLRSPAQLHPPVYLLQSNLNCTLLARSMQRVSRKLTQASKREKPRNGSERRLYSPSELAWKDGGTCSCQKQEHVFEPSTVSSKLFCRGRGRDHHNARNTLCSR